MLRPSRRLTDETVCRWHECRGCDIRDLPGPQSLRVDLIRECRESPSAMEGLRRIAARFDYDRSLARTTDDEICARITWLFSSGQLRICGVRHPMYEPPVAASRPAPPPARPVRKWVEPPPPAPVVMEESTFASSVEALSLAQILKDAAKLGIPFCEECEKARQAKPVRKSVEPPPPAAAPAVVEESTFSPSVEVTALAQVLKNAAKLGVPFCEECEKANAARRREPEVTT